MKERPIIFSTPMVRAILEGRKKQTRRILKPQPTKENIACISEELQSLNPGLFMTWVENPDGGIDEDYNAEYWKCPYGQAGDVLWVRETWRLSQIEDRVWYKAGEWDYPKSRLITVHESHIGINGDNKWKPSIFMPKKYARIWLEITDIRVERLQDIPIEDLYAEGYPNQDRQDWYGAQKWFWKVWQDINGKKHPWSTNPWVWVITFRRINEKL